MSEATKALKDNEINLARKAEIEKKIKELEGELRKIKILTPKEIIALKNEITKIEEERKNRQKHTELVLYSEECKNFLKKNIGVVEFEIGAFFDAFSRKQQGYNVNKNFLIDETIHQLAEKIENKEIDKMTREGLIMAAQYLWVEINLPEFADGDESMFTKILASKEPDEKDMYNGDDWDEEFNEPKYDADKLNTIDVLINGHKIESQFDLQQQVMCWPNNLNFDINCTADNFLIWVHNI